jgi:uncharacterized RDD family membrane protein YckC
MGAERPAGFWRRAVAQGVDAVVVGLALEVGRGLGHPLRRYDLVARAFLAAWVLVVPAAYFVIAHGATGSTLGKRLVGARVVGVDGGAIGYARALARALAWAVAALPAGLGLLRVAWHRDKRGWHDHLAGTRVIRLS